MVFYSRLNKRSRKYYANNFTRDWSSKIATGRSFLDRRFLTIHVSSEHTWGRLFINLSEKKMVSSISMKLYFRPNVIHVSTSQRLT